MKRARFAPGHHQRVQHRKQPGDTIRRSDGYILEYAPGHPRAHNGYVYQHVLVWERAHGPLPEGKQVHHVNEVRDDNRLENLEALTVAEHRARHYPGIEELRRRQRAAVEARKRNRAARERTG